MRQRQSRIVLAALVGGVSILAACGGGGGGVATAPVVATGANPGGGALAPATGGVRMTVTIHHGQRRSGRTTGSARRTAGTRRPQYVSNAAAGLQLTVTSGSSSEVLYYSLTTSNVNCTNVSFGVTSCTLVVPTLGATETLSGIEVDQQPDNVDATTGLGTAIPSNSGILAIGSTTVTLSPGTWSNVALELDPVVSQIFDCLDPTSGSNIGIGYASVYTIVVTANTPVTAVFGPAVTDYDYWPPMPLDTSPPAGEPFVDVNGSPQPLIVTSSSTHVKFFAIPNESPTPTPTFVTSATIPTSLYQFVNSYGLDLDLSIDGLETSTSTLTISNGLTATAPVFTGMPVTGPPAPPTTYAASTTYTIVPFSVAPVTLTFTSPSASMQTVTATESGATNDFTTSGTCVSSGNVTIATISSAGDIANGMQTFDVTPVAAGTCTFTLTDNYAYPPVVTNPVTVTVQGI